MKIVKYIAFELLGIACGIIGLCLSAVFIAAPFYAGAALGQWLKSLLNG